MTGCAFISKNNGKNAVSRVFVFDEFDGINVATTLMVKAMENLKTEKPIVSVDEKNLRYFRRVARAYNWDCYNPITCKFNAPIELSKVQPQK